jgi:hypothetical protein
MALILVAGFLIPNFGAQVNAPPAEREVSASSLVGGEEKCPDHLKPKSEFRSTKQIQMTKIPMTKTKTVAPLAVTK